jgi:DNA repair exonuclease SbcCD ATPase subunit
MMPTDKVTEAEIEPSNASAIQRFDRYINSVYPRTNDDTFSLEDSSREGAGVEPQSISDNGEMSSSGSERLRAEIITRARDAEEREREATERYKQLETKFKQEVALRLLAEQRAIDIEDEYKKRLGSAQSADLLRLDTELALAETRARLKQETETLRLTETALSRVKEDAKAQTQSSARALEEAENYIAELEARINNLQGKATSLEEAARRLAELDNSFRNFEERIEFTESAEEAVELAEKRIAELETVVRDLKEKAAAAGPSLLALGKAERRIAELEVGLREIQDKAVAADSNALAVEAELISTARNLGEKTAIAESTAIALEEARRRIIELEINLREGDKKVISAGEAAREMELLMREAGAREKEAELKREDIEARLQLEVQMRVTAEKRAQALENKFKSELEMDWTRFQADLEQAEAAIKAREVAIAQTGVEEIGLDPEEMIQQLYTQLEAERQARGEIEKRLAESEAVVDNEKAKFNFDAERKLAEMETALKAASVLRVEAERKLSELTIENAEMKAYYSGAIRDSAALKSSRGPLGLSKEKVRLLGYFAAVLLLFEALIFVLYLAVTAS